MTKFSKSNYPIYQNFSGKAVFDPSLLKSNLIKQLISPVKWEQSINNMITDGAKEFIEVGPGNILQGLVKKINPKIITSSLSI